MQSPLLLARALQRSEAAGAAVDYTRAHPLTVIGGALALGLAIGLLTRPGRAVERTTEKVAGRVLSNVGSSLAREVMRGIFGNMRKRY